MKDLFLPLEDVLQNTLHELEECEGQIRKLEKASGYKINELIMLFLNKQVVFLSDMDTNTKNSSDY